MLWQKGSLFAALNAALFIEKDLHCLINGKSFQMGSISQTGFCVVILAASVSLSLFLFLLSDANLISWCAFVVASKTSIYYKKNPKARAKRNAYQKELNAEPKSKKYRAELNRERRKRGIYGKGGKDVSHTKNGGTVLESRSKNRARNGANGKSTKK